MTPTEAITQVMNRAPSQVFDVDQMIAAIYGNVDEDLAPRTRQRVGVMMGHGARRGAFIKIQEDPAQYKSA